MPEGKLKRNKSAAEAKERIRAAKRERERKKKKVFLPIYTVILIVYSESAILPRNPCAARWELFSYGGCFIKSVLRVGYQGDEQTRGTWLYVYIYMYLLSLLCTMYRILSVFHSQVLFDKPSCIYLSLHNLLQRTACI